MTTGADAAHAGHTTKKEQTDLKEKGRTTTTNIRKNTIETNQAHTNINTKLTHRNKTKLKRYTGFSSIVFYKHKHSKKAKKINTGFSNIVFIEEGAEGLNLYKYYFL